MATKFEISALRIAATPRICESIGAFSAAITAVAMPATVSESTNTDTRANRPGRAFASASAPEKR